MVTGKKYSAKTRCFTAVIFDPVTEIMSSLPRCNHQTISEIWSKSTMRRLARGATVATWSIDFPRLSVSVARLSINVATLSISFLILSVRVATLSLCFSRRSIS